MSRDDRIVKYGAVYVPEEKVKETAKRGAPKSSGKMDEIEEAIRELQDEMKKSNRDNLDAMYNIDEENLSSSYRKKIDGQFIAAYSAIKTWADSQSAGFEAVAKWQSETEDKLEGYVTQTNLDASIKSYIEDNTATLVSAVEGSFVKISTDENGKKITETSEVLAAITQQVSKGIGQLSLSVSNGKESSTIKLMNGTTAISSNTIQMTGLVKFSDLSTEGSTTINGANITTGKINASLVDTSDLVVENVWLKSGIIAGEQVKILDSNESGGNIFVNVGLDKQVMGPNETIFPNLLNLRGRYITFALSGETPTLQFDTEEEAIIPTSSWNIGLSDNRFTNIYVNRVRCKSNSGGIYFANSRLYVDDDGWLRFYNAETDITTTIVDS